MPRKYKVRVYENTNGDKSGAVAYYVDVFGVPIKLPGYEDIPMIIHRDINHKDYFIISDVATGCSISKYPDKDKYRLVVNTLAVIEKFGGKEKYLFHQQNYLVKFAPLDKLPKWTGNENL